MADGTLVSQRSLKGRDGVDGVNGKNGKDGINGHSPVVEVRPDKYIYVDGKRQQYLKGDTGAKGDKGTNGKDGHTPTLALDTSYRLVADGKLVSSHSLKGPKGGTQVIRAIKGTSRQCAGTGLNYSLTTCKL